MNKPTPLELANALRALRMNLLTQAALMEQGVTPPHVIAASEVLARYGRRDADGSEGAELAIALQGLWHRVEAEARHLRDGERAHYVARADAVLARFDARHQTDVGTAALSLLARMFDMFNRNADLLTQNEHPDEINSICDDTAALLDRAGADVRTPGIVAALRALPRYEEIETETGIGTFPETVERADGRWICADQLHELADRIEADYARGLEAIEASDEDDECVIALANGRALHVPASPLECSFVRVVENGQEIGYWNADEWRDEPEEVMGALMGLAKGGLPVTPACEPAAA